MDNTTKVDLITYNEKKKEVSLILVEEGPWISDDLTERLYKIQKWIYNVIDIAIEGILAEKYPETKGMAIKVQIDCYDDPPNEVEDLIFRLSEHINNDEKSKKAILNSYYINGIKIVFKKAAKVANSSSKEE